MSIYRSSFPRSRLLDRSVAFLTFHEPLVKRDSTDRGRDPGLVKPAADEEQASAPATATTTATATAEAAAVAAAATATVTAATSSEESPAKTRYAGGGSPLGDQSPPPSETSSNSAKNIVVDERQTPERSPLLLHDLLSFGSDLEYNIISCGGVSRDGSTSLNLGGSAEPECSSIAEDSKKRGVTTAGPGGGGDGIRLLAADIGEATAGAMRLERINVDLS